MSDLAELDEYLEHLSAALGHADRRISLRDYCQGLMLPIARKSIEPLAAHTDPMRVRAKHQSLHHFVAKSTWSDSAILESVRNWVQPTLACETGHYWIVDDTGFPKKGKHSVGVARQYCGQLGKQDNCQVAVSLSLATELGSIPIAYQLYLPKDWASDAERRRKAGVPDAQAFATKPEIALEQLRAAIVAKVPPGVVLADAAYGDETAFRDAVTEMGLLYAVGIRPATTVWPPGVSPLPPIPQKGRGRPSSLLRRGPGHEPASVKEVAMGLPTEAYQQVHWREGSNSALSSRFAALRVRPAHRDIWRSEQRAEEWLLIEWPEGDAEPLKYFLSTAPIDATLEQIVFVTKMRWRIERDYQDLKQEFGLGHYEGRGWQGFHHHATLCIAVYGFLISQRLNDRDAKKNSAQPKIAPLPDHYVPRGSRANATPCT